MHDEQVSAKVESMMQQFELEQGADAAMMARLGCLIMSLHLSSRLIQDEEQSNESLQLIYGDVMSMVSDRLEVPSDRIATINKMVMNITNSISDQLGYGWRMETPAPASPLILDPDIVSAT